MTTLQDSIDASEQRPPALPRSWTFERVAGNLTLAFWLVAGILLVWYLIDAWAPEKVARYGPKYISGLLTTLSLVGISLVIGALLSIPVAIGRMSKNKLIGRIAFAYVYVFRGTPLIAQLFLIYYGLGSFRPQLEAVGLWGFFREAWNCAVFSFSLNTAAYQAEILRGAVESVPKGQWEGAAALGLNRFQTLYKIILPQALIVALRPYGNEIILMIKGSAIVALATVYDLMGETRRAYSRTYDFQTYIWAAIFYLVIVETLRNVWSVVETRLTRHLQR
ncbi:ABC transporter permease subunit [Nitratireductor sp. CAU 1489]|uniref:ABC transporter permease subunit n=1 Tax=Nitratireductor arenosus TaxID=2682096 RepID=A0A844QI86_9HYPH|nr:ABC transporter permease [Nitratireductor arenosus]MVA97768.1 ABC transporter permease subunit [Nitratireductor arenosus]